jgi:hypothetical protein
MTAVFVEEGPDKGAIWHFGEPNKEQKALLEGKAWADLSHLAVIAVTGDDRLKWLHDLTTQHLVDFGVGIWTTALILEMEHRGDTKSTFWRCSGYVCPVMRRHIRFGESMWIQ